MSHNLFVFAFDYETGARDLLERLRELQERDLLVIADAVIASRGPGLRVDIEQTQSTTGKYARRGAGIGFLAGLLLGGPIGGAVAGTAVGAITGSMKRQGIDQDFVEEVSDSVRPNSSTLFLLASSEDGATVLRELDPLNARVLTTTLKEEQERQLRTILGN